ncbi:flagella synthesis protein FlgN [Zoogloea sp.]|uniref:flagella synthesis protein FlgN n=1 Tax=Zoogloea sp. TaxID=49181 RepID=UPI0035AE9569
MATVDQTFVHRLAVLIGEERDGLQKFIALLQQEEALLIAGKIDTLTTLAEEKTALYRALQRLSDDRTVMFARVGARVSNENIRLALGSLPDALTSWDEVIALATEAKERNRVNGQLIRDRLQNNQQALTTLLSAAEHPQIYGQDGQSRPTGGGRHLGSA